MAVLAAEARVETDPPSRYLVQLCRHASLMGQHGAHRLRTHDDGRAPPEVQHVEWSETHGSISFGSGRCTMQATPQMLTLRIQTTEEEHLQWLQVLLARRLETIGRRDQLAVNWHRTEPLEPQPGAVEQADDPRPKDERWARAGHRRTMALTAAGTLGAVLLISVHVLLGGAALATSQWLLWVPIGLLAVPLVAVLGHAVVPVTIIGLRRRFGSRDGAEAAPKRPAPPALRTSASAPPQVPHPVPTLDG